MRLRIPPLVLAATLLAVVLVSRAAADGFPVGPVGPGEAQSHPVVLVDGQGGAIVAYKTAGLRVGAVRVDHTGAPAGSPAFDPEPVPFALESSQPTRAWWSAAGRVLVAADRATAAGSAISSFEPDGSASQATRSRWACR